MAYPKIVPLNWQTVKKSVTSFFFSPFYDPLISSQLLVPLVLNKAETRENGGEGKKQGFGMAGGGVNPEWMDTLSGAAKREMEDESGLVVSKINQSPLIEEPQLIISDKKTEERIKLIRYEKGKEPAVKIDAHKQTAICNPVYTFTGQVVWDNSPLQKLTHKIKNEWLSDQPGKEEDINLFTDKYGIYFLLAELSDEEINLLSITEKHEIDGFGVFPLPMLISMLEDRHPYFENLYFYYTHLKRVKECATKLNLVPAPTVGSAS